ncbi:MAG: winged helix-turn-helix domain-containing protein [Halovenus sp.]
MASVTARPSEQSSNDVQTIVAETAVQALLDALDDADCRAILDATREKALTASEISEIHDLPLSTTYRKLDLLTEAGLLEERTRIRRSGKHASEYIRLVDDVAISLGPRGETEVRLSQGKRRGLSRSERPLR